MCSSVAQLLGLLGVLLLVLVRCMALRLPEEASESALTRIEALMVVIVDLATR
jgi:hypothetical protein